MQQFQEEMDVIGNNIANVNTTGYKSARVDFADTLSQTLQGTGGLVQVGTGVATETIANQFTSGAIASTGTASDLAISGQGFFLVTDPVSGETFATRAGNFQVKDDYLVTASGLRVQGYTDASHTTVGDIMINNAGSGSTAGVKSYAFGTDGTLTVNLTDGTSFTRGQVLLQNFNSPQTLLKEGDNLYSGLTNAGPLAAPAVPTTNGVGSIVGSSLEGSNVDLTNEMASMITAQRAYQASARVITTSDEMLQELVNLKH